MGSLFDQLTAKVSNSNKKIVFPEGLDERILTAASQLSAAGVVTPILIGNQESIEKRRQQTTLTLLLVRSSIRRNMRNSMEWSKLS